MGVGPTGPHPPKTAPGLCLPPLRNVALSRFCKRTAILWQLYRCFGPFAVRRRPHRSCRGQPNADIVTRCLLSIERVRVLITVPFRRATGIGNHLASPDLLPYPLPACLGIATSLVALSRLATCSHDLNLTGWCSKSGSSRLNRGAILQEPYDRHHIMNN